MSTVDFILSVDLRNREEKLFATEGTEDTEKGMR